MPPEPTAYLPVDALPVRAGDVALLIEVADQALEAVLRRDDHEDHGQGHQDQQAAEHPPGSADDPQQREEDDQQDERGAQVVTRHHEQAEHARSGHERDEHVPPVGQLTQLLLAGQQVGAPYHQGELGDLGRLDLLPAEVDPPGRAVLRDADAADEREAEPDHRDRQQRVGEGTEQPGRRACRHPHQRQADGGAEKLLGEVGVRREPRGQVDHRRGGLHHDQAEAEQQHGDAQDEIVGRERPIEQRAPHTDPVPHAAQTRQPERIGGR